MKKHSFFASALLLTLAPFGSGNLWAQWSQNGTSIWNSNLNQKVGIGTNNPANNIDCPKRN